ncbi:MAG: hypothetical protein LBQ22_07915 [Bacteroidales bacterium]|jgi:citrate lyase beta subunit|nr:hypothetical protein [Bacteroidales bacterium]
MLKTFLFTPANNLKFIRKSEQLSADYLIFDLEDAVLNDEFGVSIENLKTVCLQDKHFARFGFFNDKNQLESEKFEILLNLGFRNFVIPKFIDIEQIKKIHAFLQDTYFIDKVSFILLIENPVGLLNLFDVLKSRLLNFIGLGLGSHDYCNAMNMEHSLANLYFARQMVLNNAKAFNIIALDIVSTDLEDDNSFREESLNGFRMGFDAKFLIHPKQLDLLKKIKYYTDEEIAEAEKVYERILDIQNQKASVISIDGRVYEKPHVKRIINIVNWRRTYGS